MSTSALTYPDFNILVLTHYFLQKIITALNVAIFFIKNQRTLIFNINFLFALFLFYTGNPLFITAPYLMQTLASKYCLSLHLNQKVRDINIETNAEYTFIWGGVFLWKTYFYMNNKATSKWNVLPDYIKTRLNTKGTVFEEFTC